MVGAVNSVRDFLKRSIVLGSLYGIPVRVDYSWFFVFVALIWLVAVYVPGKIPLTSSARILLALVTVTVFFLTLLAHEIAHAFAARREGIPVIEIHLHPFGGVAELRREPETPGSELKIAIAGPLMSLALALVFGTLYYLSAGAGVDALASLLFVIFLLNLFLAVFNMFPGFPLDGGRVLRAILRKKGMELVDATRLTANFGQIIGAVGIFSGVFLILINRDWLTGVWSVLIGVYLFSIARGYVSEVGSHDELRAVDLIELPVIVALDMTIQQFVDKIVVFHRQTVFPVAEKRQLFGFVLLEDIKNQHPRKEWGTLKVREVMRPIEESFFVDADASFRVVRELLSINGIGIIGVIDSKGKFAGTIRRGRIRRRN